MILSKVMRIALVICAVLLCKCFFAQGYVGKSGSAGVVITPRGSKNYEGFTSAGVNSISFKSTTNKILPFEARNMLMRTNVVAISSLHNKYCIAFASMLFADNTALSKTYFKEIFDLAVNNEGKLYALMAEYFFFGAEAFEKLSKTLPLDAEVSVIYDDDLYKMPISKFKEAFLKDPVKFIPDESVITSSSKLYESRTNFVPTKTSRPIIIRTN